MDENMNLEINENEAVVDTTVDSGDEKGGNALLKLATVVLAAVGTVTCIKKYRKSKPGRAKKFLEKKGYVVYSPDEVVDCEEASPEVTEE